VSVRTIMIAHQIVSLQHCWVCEYSRQGARHVCVGSAALFSKLKNALAHVSPLAAPPAAQALPWLAGGAAGCSCFFLNREIQLSEMPCDGNLISCKCIVC
jgi:hypothetical protein